MKQSRTRIVICLLLCSLGIATSVHADWLVTQEGKQVQTKGPWEVRRNMVVFTLPNGTLSSMRLSEVDLEKSKELTLRAAQPKVEEEAEPEATKPSVLVLTNRDVGSGDGGATGPDALVERMENAHKFQDLGLLMGLVNWQDTPESIRTVMETQFQWMLERQIKDILLEEVAPGESPKQVQDGVTFEPNVDVTHKIEVQFVPDPDAEELLLTFYIGTRLGSYHIAAARPVEEGF